MVGFRSACFPWVLIHRTALRVGYVEARPWTYRAERDVLGLDTTAMSLVARAMGCTIEYRPRSPLQLADGLLNDEYDVAIGGLFDPRHPGIVSVAVPHAKIIVSVDRFRACCRRAFFPNVWWMRRCDLRLRYRVAFILLGWRLGMNATGAVCLEEGPEEGRSSFPQRVKSAPVPAASPSQRQLVRMKRRYSVPSGAYP